MRTWGQDGQPHPCLGGDQASHHEPQTPGLQREAAGQRLQVNAAATRRHTRGCRESSWGPRAEGPNPGGGPVDAPGRAAHRAARPLDTGHQQWSAHQKTQGQMLGEQELRPPPSRACSIRVRSSGSDSFEQLRGTPWGFPRTPDFALFKLCSGTSCCFSP